MNGLYLHAIWIWVALESIKDGKKVNVFYVVDWSHERSVVVLDHFRNFKGRVVTTSKIEEARVMRGKMKHLVLKFNLTPGRTGHNA